MKAIISLGSNINQVENIAKAKEILQGLLHGISFTEAQWTEPVGVVSDKFLNCLGIFDTELTKEELKRMFKEIERKMGDSHENHQKAIVLIDIDLLNLGEEIIKKPVPFTPL